MRSVLVLLIAVMGVPAQASPGPPPPDYIWKAGELLTASAARDDQQIAALFAPDVVAWENGDQVAAGKAAWLVWRAAGSTSAAARVIGYSASSASATYRNGSGELLVVDTFDTVDRRNLPADFLADPRMATRSTLYQFGPDHLIHVVRIARVGGFWMTPGR